MSYFFSLETHNKGRFANASNAVTSQSDGFHLDYYLHRPKNVEDRLEPIPADVDMKTWSKVVHKEEEATTTSTLANLTCLVNHAVSIYSFH